MPPISLTIVPLGSYLFNKVSTNPDVRSYSVFGLETERNHQWTVSGSGVNGQCSDVQNGANESSLRKFGKRQSSFVSHVTALANGLSADYP